MFISGVVVGGNTVGRCYVGQDSLCELWQKCQAKKGLVGVPLKFNDLDSGQRTSVANSLGVKIIKKKEARPKWQW